MGRRGSPIPACCKKYGVPLYCASWIPLHEIQQQNEDDDDDKETSQSQQSYYLVLGGGGGEGRSGIPNALLLTQFHFSSASLPDQPVDELRTEGDVPYRMAVHPRGEGLLLLNDSSHLANNETKVFGMAIIQPTWQDVLVVLYDGHSKPSAVTCCGISNVVVSCRWFKWGALENKEDQKVALKLSEKVLRELENVGLQLALAFNSDGSMLASGGEDGHLRVFKWPSMEVLLDQPDAHASVKDLDFSYDGKFLACSGSSGPCRVWDLASLEVVANLPRQNGEVFGFCRFSLRDDDNQLLYVTTMLGKHGGVVSWNTRSWNRGGSRRVVRDQISAFNVSFDGKHLAIASGTSSCQCGMLNGLVDDDEIDRMAFRFTLLQPLGMVSEWVC
ncbi:hypothetical protein ACLOJK_015630 [Asimina triloba]